MNTPPSLRNLPARLDAVLARAIDERRIVGMVVLVVRDGEFVYQRAVGALDREAATPMHNDAIFLLASVTKIITSTAVMCLMEQGRIGLYDPVTRWLPEFRPTLADGSTPLITMHHLLTHTAGLAYDFAEPRAALYSRLGISTGLDQAGLSLQENVQRIAQATLAFAPGSQWRYSMAIDVLGAVVAAACGQSLQQAIERLVTGPLGMPDTRFEVADVGRLATPYSDGNPEPLRMGTVHQSDYEGDTITFAPGRLLDPRAYPSGGAGMAGTAIDVMRLLETLRNGGGDLLRPATVAAMMQDYVLAIAPTYTPGWGFGYGGAVLVDPSLTGTPQSKGTFYWSGAYGHHWFIDPAKRLSVVILTNTAFEGMEGRFPAAVRDAVYAAEYG